MNLNIARYDTGFEKQLRKLRNTNKRHFREDRETSFAQRVRHMAESGAGVSDRDFERLIGRNDLLRINYLERGLLAARAVCRIYVPDLFGAGSSWGTGFLVGPNLLLTNHHVIESLDRARPALAEFGYEADVHGKLRQGRRFALTPDRGFLSDAELDFTIVAVADASEDGTGQLKDYGYLRLNPTLHKVEEIEFVTIIQHPDGDEKYIAIRENKVIKIGDGDPLRDNMLWYASDTAPGSSGAPAFNDSWQVVAIHHRGVPETRMRDGREEWRLTSNEWMPREQAEKLPDDRIHWIANEGVRVSKILGRVELLQKNANGARSDLIQSFLDDVQGVRPQEGAIGRESIVGPSLLIESAQSEEASADTLEAKKVKQNIRAASYYAGRRGYEEDFLGVAVPLPKLTNRALAFGSVAPVTGSNDDVLRYTHFSVVFNADRRLAFFTAVNIDGQRWKNLERGNDKWFYDPRIDMSLQLGDELYGDEPKTYGTKGWFDRGHLVRRLDPVWGELQTAGLADGDTFHWTNCSPQYWGFNQGEYLWQGLENFILYNTDDEDVRASVFSGPLFQDDDEEHRGALIPQFYWKVVTVKDKAGKLYSSAYVVSQKKYAQNIPFEELPVGQFNNFQTSIAKLEARTGLDFGATVRDADVNGSTGKDHELRTVADIRHPRR